MFRRTRHHCRIAFGLVAVLFCLPPSGTWGVGGALAHETGEKHTHATEEAAPVESDSKTRGIGLGEFRIRAYYPVEAKRSTVEFTLYGIVPTENAGEFERLLQNRAQKVRDQVIVATRLAPLADFDDPELKQFRRRILLRLRRALPELEMDDIYVSDFQLEVREI